MSQSAAVSRTKQMSLEQPFKLSETITLAYRCLQLLSEGCQWLCVSDRGRQTVPGTTSQNWKRAIFKGYLPKGYTFYVEFELAISISPSLLVRLSPSLVNVSASCPVFIVIIFYLGCMLANWDRLLILLQWAVLLSTASISIHSFCFTTVR